MKKSDVPAPTTESSAGLMLHDLEFPIDRDFVSRPPFVDPQVMLRRIEQSMHWRSTLPGEKERRLAETINEEFVL